MPVLMAHPVHKEVQVPPAHPDKKVALVNQVHLEFLDRQEIQGFLDWWEIQAIQECLVHQALLGHQESKVLLDCPVSRVNRVVKVQWASQEDQDH